MTHSPSSETVDKQFSADADSPGADWAPVGEDEQLVWSGRPTWQSRLSIVSLSALFTIAGVVLLLWVDTGAVSPSFGLDRSGLPDFMSSLISDWGTPSGITLDTLGLGWVRWVLPVTLTGFGLVGIAKPIVALRHRYAITTDAIYERAGLTASTVRTVPLDRIRETSRDRSLLGRVLGYETLTIATTQRDIAAIVCQGVEQSTSQAGYQILLDMDADVDSTVDLRREYLRVTPSTGQLPPQEVVDRFAGLHKLDGGRADGLSGRVPPYERGPAPTFEFVALSEGADAPIEFYYTTDQYFDTLEERLRNAYPDTFDVERVKCDLAAKLVTPVEYTPEEFRTALDNGELQCSPPEVEALKRVTTAESHEPGPAPERTSPSTAGSEPGSVSADGGFTKPTVTDPEDEGLLASLPTIPLTESGGAAASIAETPIATTDGTILARPDVETVDPFGVQWDGDGDWMTPLKTFIDIARAEASLPAEAGTGSRSRPAQARTPLAAVLDQLGDAETPLAFQVLFERNSNWQNKADDRKENLRQGRGSFADVVNRELQRFLSAFRSEEELKRDYYMGRTETQLESEESHPTADERALIEAITAKQPHRTYTAAIRAVAIGPHQASGSPVRASPEPSVIRHEMETLSAAFDPLDGTDYEIVGDRVRERGFRTATKRARARKVLRRLLTREIGTSWWRRGWLSPPQLVLNADELANFVVVPAAGQLSAETRRETYAEQASRNPLSPPDRENLAQFNEGMAIGNALDPTSEQRHPICLPPSVQNTHIGRYAATGAGKTVAMISDTYTAHASTPGPTVLLDRKGDGMIDEYLQVHYEQFGTLDNVYWFKLPDIIPALSFFDIRPELARGQHRTVAVQHKVEQFHEIGRIIMGRKEYNNAYAAVDVITFLIKALFDPEHGSDAFGIDELYEAALEMGQNGTLPEVSARNVHLLESLDGYAVGEDQFDSSMRAVINRLNKIKQNSFLHAMFDHVPDWDEEQAGYVDPRFEFRTLVDEEVTILFDMGELRKASQRALSLVLLTNLWDGVQYRRRDSPTEHEWFVNVIIDESAPIVGSRLVADEFLAQGRSYGVCLELVMHYPTQMRKFTATDDDTDAYGEVLANIQTHLLGDTWIDDTFANTLTNDELSIEAIRNRLNQLPAGEWLASLPSPMFNGTVPRVFSLEALPIPAGHPESNKPLSGSEREGFEHEVESLVERSERDYGLDLDLDAGGTLGVDEWAGDQLSAREEEADPTSEASAAGEEESDEGLAVYDVGLPWHIEADRQAAVYRCQICGSEYESTEHDVAVECCSFEDEEEVLELARKLLTSAGVGNVQSCLGRLVGRAAECGVEVSLGDIDALDADSSGGTPSSDTEPTASSGESSDGFSDEDRKRGRSEETEREPEEVSSAPDPFLPESFETVSDAKLDEHGLTRDDATFLGMVLAMMNDTDSYELADVSLLDGMSSLPERAGDPNIAWLKDLDFIEETYACSHRYYTVLPAGREFLDLTLKAQPGVGDLGEKTPHKVGVELLRQWLEQREDVAHAEKYYVYDGDESGADEEDDEVIFDVVAFDHDGDLAWVGETETPSNNAEAVVGDYEKLSLIDAPAIWAVSDRSTAREVLRVLHQADRLPSEVSGRATRSFDGIREAVASFDDSGMALITGFQELHDALEETD